MSCRRTQRTHAWRGYWPERLGVLASRCRTKVGHRSPRHAVAIRRGLCPVCPSCIRGGPFAQKKRREHPETLIEATGEGERTEERGAGAALERFEKTWCRTPRRLQLVEKLVTMVVGPRPVGPLVPAERRQTRCRTSEVISGVLTVPFHSCCNGCCSGCCRPAG